MSMSRISRQSGNDGVGLLCHTGVKHRLLFSAGYERVKGQLAPVPLLRSVVSCKERKVHKKGDHFHQTRSRFTFSSRYR